MQEGTKIIEQVDLTQRGISEDSETVRASRYRSLRFQIVPLGSRVCMVCAFLLNWKNLQVFPPFTLIGPGINQSHSGEMRNNTCYTSLVSELCYIQLLRLVVADLILIPHFQSLLVRTTSASKSQEACLCMSKILKREKWSNAITFEKSYN